jgi:hypothetical protein
MNEASAISDYQKDDLECLNLNMNVNGLNFTALPDPLRNLLESQAQTEDLESGSTSGNNDKNGLGYEKDFAFICKNFNENEVIIPPTQTPNQPIENNVYVVWEESVTPENDEIFFTASYDNGRTFSSPINISNTPNQNSFDPLLTTEGNNVYVVWLEEFTVDNNEIFFTSSNNNGRTFSSPDNLSENDDVDSLAPQISSKGNNVYVVWYDEITPSNREIFIAVSNNNGATFSFPPDNLSNSPETEDSFDPQISSTGNNVYVVWEETITPTNHQIFFRASNNNGATFSFPPDNLSNSPETEDSRDPQISSTGNNVYVVWQDDTSGNNEILFAESDDNGDNFDMPDNISRTAEGSFVPQISSAGNNVYVVWQDSTPTTPNNDVDIFFVASNNNGQTFSFPPDNLSNTITSSFDPKISSEGNNVYIIWEDNLQNVDVFFIASNDNGNTFPNPKVNLSNNEAGSLNPQISSEGNNVYVVWDDNTPPDDEIFFRLSDNSGDNFGQVANLSKSTGDSNDAQISSNTS